MDEQVVEIRERVRALGMNVFEVVDENIDKLRREASGSLKGGKAEDQGVTPGSLYGQAKDKVTRVAGAASEAAKDEAQAQNLGGRGTSRS